MSNTDNILVKDTGSLGPANLVLDPVVETGDTGSAISVEGTLGVSLKYTVSKSDLMSDQDGTEAFNRVATGELCEVTFNLVKGTLLILEQAIQGFIAHTSGTEGFSQSSAIGQDDLSIAVPLEIILQEDGVDSTDGDDQIIIPACAPTAEAEFSYSAGDQRQTSITYRCYKSRKYTDATTGKGLFYFSRSALANGHVLVGSGDVV